MSATVVMVDPVDFLARYRPVDYQSWSEMLNLTAYDLEDREVWRCDETPTDYVALVASIRADGIREPVEVRGDRLWNGHHRVAIAVRYGLPIPTAVRR